MSLGSDQNQLEQHYTKPQIPDKWTLVPKLNSLLTYYELHVIHTIRDCIIDSEL